MLDMVSLILSLEDLILDQDRLRGWTLSLCFRPSSRSLSGSLDWQFSSISLPVGNCSTLDHRRSFLVHGCVQFVSEWKEKKGQCDC